MKIRKPCVECGTPFITTRCTAQYCSGTCRVKANRKKKKEIADNANEI
jgi:predicted nucleic acid-binding Zn ribbon protein